MKITVLPTAENKNAPAQKGLVRWQNTQAACALGKGGLVLDKREGDGKTPIGTFALKLVYFRPDHHSDVATKLPKRPITQQDGWCDDAKNSLYNKRVTLPFAESHEKLWRDDDLYDVVIVLGHNDDPVIPGHGSAIFIHVAKPGFLPTEGCIALKKEDLLALLKDCDGHDIVEILPQP